jgi:hypothetical protein
MQTETNEREPVVDSALVRAFERRLDVLRPEATRGAKILGFGEISVVFELDEHPGLVFKRVAGFRAGEDARYAAVVKAYVHALEARGVRVAPVTTIAVPGRGGPIVYLAQRRLESTTLGHRVLQTGSDRALQTLLESVLEHVGAVVGDGTIGLDAQLSNWSAAGELVYLDLSTPLLRENGAERLPLGFLLRSLPDALGWALTVSGKKRSMLDRYYDRRHVAMDIVSNFVKERRGDRLAFGIDVVNRWLAEQGSRPLTIDEVRADYRADARTWALLQWVRRPDRFLRTKVLKRPYDFLLQPPLERQL